MFSNSNIKDPVQSKKSIITTPRCKNIGAGHFSEVFSIPNTVLKLLPDAKTWDSYDCPIDNEAEIALMILADEHGIGPAVFAYSLTGGFVIVERCTRPKDAPRNRIDQVEKQIQKELGLYCNDVVSDNVMWSKIHQKWVLVDFSPVVMVPCGLMTRKQFLKCRRRQYKNERNWRLIRENGIIEWLKH